MLLASIIDEARVANYLILNQIYPVKIDRLLSPTQAHSSLEVDHGPDSAGPCWSPPQVDNIWLRSQDTEGAGGRGE